MSKQSLIRIEWTDSMDEIPDGNHIYIEHEFGRLFSPTIVSRADAVSLKPFIRRWGKVKFLSDEECIICKVPKVYCHC